MDQVKIGNYLKTVRKNKGLTQEAMEVEDLSGVEYFPALKVLECPAYELTSLDVSKNTFLRELNCSDSQLTELDVSKNTAQSLTDIVFEK